MTELFSQSDIHKVFPHHATRTLKGWVESGLVGWMSEHEDKRGLHRVYSIENLYQFAIVAELSELNFPLRFIKGILHYLSPLEYNMGSILAIFKITAEDILTKKVSIEVQYNCFDPSELEIHMKAYRHSPFYIVIRLPVIAEKVNNAVKML